MKRRDFMKMMAATGLCLSVPVGAQKAYAATPERFWVMVHAGGGWDPTSLCDPKGNAPRSDGRGPVNSYAAADIKQAGAIRYSPIPVLTNLTDTGAFDTFFTTHQSRLLVINGIDTQTNSHDTGTRFVWSGKSDMGHPSFAAMVAAAVAPNQPMSFITNGGYDFTDSIVAASRVSGSGTFSRLAFPDRIDPNDANHRYFSSDVYAHIERAREQRLQGLIADEPLPQRRATMSQLFAARDGNAGLDTIVSRLPATLSGGMKGQAEMAAAAFASGLAVSANLTSGGFDTHGDHDRSQYRSLQALLDGVNHLWAELERHGIADRTTILIGSDFGRTPFYNEGNGKDHWNVTSLMAMGAGITGGRVIGATSDLYKALKVNPTTLEVSDGEGSVTITPAHIHRALRRLAGINGSELDRSYPVPADDLNLFS